MADNILKAIVQIDTKGVPAAMSNVSNSVGKAETSLKKLSPASGQATQSLVNLSRVAQDAPYGFIGIANNINPLLESFQRLKVEAGSNKGALQALKGALMGPAGIGLAVGAASSLLVVFGDKLFGSSKAAKAAKDANKELSESLANDFVKLASLIGLAQNVNATTEDRARAIKKLNEDYGKYLSLTDKDVINSNNLLQSYKGIVDALIKRAVVAGLQKEIEVKVAETASEILRIEKSRREEAEKLERKKQSAAAKEQQQQDNYLKRAQNFNRAVSDGYNANINAQNELLEGRKDFEKTDAIDRLKAKLFESLKPLLGIVDTYRELSDFSVDPKVKLDKVKLDKLKPEKFVPTRMESLNLGKAIVERIQEGLMGVKTPLTFNEILANKINADISKLVVTPDIKIAYNKEEFDAATKRNEQLKNTAELITGVVTPAFQNMFSTIASGGNAFKAFGDAAAQALMQVISKLLTTAILSAILGPLLGAGSAMGASSSKFGDVFKFLMGGGGLAGMRANGGPVQAGKRYLVGERGMEIFTPSTSGMITPNHAINNYSGVSMAGMFDSVVFEISGNRLIGVLSNAGRSQGRLV